MIALSKSQKSEILDFLTEDVIVNGEKKFAAKANRTIIALENIYDYEEETKEFYEFSDYLQGLSPVGLVDKKESFIDGDYFYSDYAVRFKDQEGELIDIICYYEVED